MPIRRRTYRIHIAGIEILTIEQHTPAQRAALDKIVHAVQGPQHRAFAAAGRADEGCHLAVGNLHEHPAHGLTAAVTDAHILEGETDGLCWR